MFIHLWCWKDGYDYDYDGDDHDGFWSWYYDDDSDSANAVAIYIDYYYEKINVFKQTMTHFLRFFFVTGGGILQPPL